MRNLRNTRHNRLKVDNGQHITATAWDATDDSLVFTTGPDETTSTITLQRLSSSATDISDATPIASWPAPPTNPDVAHDTILDLHCFPDTQTHTLILSGGDIILVRSTPENPDAEGIEILGSVDAGLLAVGWSPDEEVVALVTAADTLLLMTQDFEPLATIPLAASDVAVSDHVSVGWGKRETQFKGRGAAAVLRDPTLPEHVDEGRLSERDDPSRVSVAWRGDGECFAVCAVLEGEVRRRIVRVFSREGVLESVSEPVDGLEAALSWKPSGQLIAGVQRLEGRVDVVLFERNGLRHGEFSLRLSKEECATIGDVVDLKWNLDSTVLAVSVRDRVQLWTMGNYHYYLKQEIRFEPSSHGPARTLWHPERPLQLCSFNSAQLRRLEYNLEVCRGSVTVPNDLGLVAVIDGAVLKVSPLRIANIPPPMAFDEVDLPCNALDVAIHESGTELAILHADGSVTRWQCDYAPKPAKMASLKSSTEIKDDSSTVIHLGEAASGHLYARTDHDRLYYENPLSTDGDAEDQAAAEVRSTDAVEATWHGPFGVIIRFRLEQSGQLRIESDIQTLRISGCTSFVTTPSHLIYTTSQHLLKFIHLHEGQLDVPADEPEKDERCRSIERGAKIVTVIPSALSLVLQMPRGNLETIYPRALVLAGIRQSLRQKEYKAAFRICRTHRVDMNILHDYAPEPFMRDVELVVSQLSKTEYLDLLLSSLSEQDVSETIYRETLAPIETSKPNGVVNGDMSGDVLSATSKVNRICDAFLRVLQKSGGSRLQNIVTAHVCKNPPDLEAGLNLIAELRRQADQARLEQAVEHICFLADVNQLYDTALGLYDLDVAVLVAQQSQKDPREYLPYLQALHEMPELKKRFAIDNDLKRYPKALAHLHSQDEFEELKVYMGKHELYSIAIDLYRYDSARLTEIMRLYADYLSSRNRFKEAGIAYEYISDPRSAYEAFRAVGLWKQCLSNAASVPISADELSSLAQDLASNAEEAKEFNDAATIHLDYLNDLDAAAKLWCKAHNFAEAIRQVTLRHQPSLLRTIIDPGLIESSATMTELLAEMKSQLAAQVPRLRELRVKKHSDPIAFLDGGGDGGTGETDLPDNISLAPTDASTSAGTFLTRYTNASMGTLGTSATRKTSKNRRREERKRARGKKGTVYEEEYLVNSIARLMERLNAVGEDVEKLVEGLMRRAMRERAVAVQAALDEVVAACRGCMLEVFPASTAVQAEGEENAGVRPVGGEGVLFDAIAAPRREAPALKAFERLGLLG